MPTRHEHTQSGVDSLKCVVNSSEDEGLSGVLHFANKRPDISGVSLGLDSDDVDRVAQHHLDLDVDRVAKHQLDLNSDDVDRVAQHQFDVDSDDVDRVAQHQFDLDSDDVDRVAQHQFDLDSDDMDRVAQHQLDLDSDDVDRVAQHQLDLDAADADHVAQHQLDLDAADRLRLVNGHVFYPSRESNIVCNNDSSEEQFHKSKNVPIFEADAFSDSTSAFLCPPTVITSSDMSRVLFDRSSQPRDEQDLLNRIESSRAPVLRVEVVKYLMWFCL